MIIKIIMRRPSLLGLCVVLFSRGVMFWLNF